VVEGEHSLSVGEVVDGRFRVDAKIGTGGMGEVYRAQQLNVGRDVALKLLRRDRVGNEAAVEQFLVEATAVSRLTSPHTVTLYDVGRLEDGAPFIAMELLEGQTLRSRLARGRLETKEAFRILDGIALSLSEAHARGIVHRDLKPSNVMLADTPGHSAHVKVVDFGLARLDAAGAPVRAAGTPLYMAPEAMRRGKVTARTDVYALGMLAYELFAGLHPFGDIGRDAIAQAQLSEIPPPLDEACPDLPNAAVHLIAQALAKSPRLRPADAGVFRARLRQAFGVDDGPRDTQPGATGMDTVTVGPTNDPTMFTPPVPSPRPWRAAALGGAAMVGAVVLVRTLFGPSAPTDGAQVSALAPDAVAVAEPTNAPSQPSTSSPAERAPSASTSPATAPPNTGDKALPTVRPPPASAPPTPSPKAPAPRDEPPAVKPSADPCRPNPPCFLFGACTTVNGSCTATSSADCRASDNCALNGACTASGGECRRLSSADCALMDECRIIGDCTFKGGRCVK
jgi:eukaryotic-like serine/threonine-protein kinase